MFKVLKFGTKVGVATAVAYTTTEAGVWKDSETTSVLYNDLKKSSATTLKPYVEQIPINLPELPRTGSLTTTCQNTWNSLVLQSCLGLTRMPDLICGYTKSGYVYIKEAIQNLDNLPKQNGTT